MEAIFYDLLEARTCWINFGESFAGLKNSQTRPSLNESNNLSRNLQTSFQQKSKSFSKMPNNKLKRMFTKEDSEGKGDTTTDREQNLETDRTDERRSNPESPARPQVRNLRIEGNSEQGTFQGEEEKPVI